MNSLLSTTPTPTVPNDAYTWPWRPDLENGTYQNPILYADYSDPDVIRVGADFYLTASSFNCTPGLPILHSKDLVNWTLIGHALKNLPDPRYEKVQPGAGVWAPAIRFHAGKYWIFFSMPDEGIYLVTANHPAGPWSEPHLVQAGKGLINPCPLWDDDGRAYLVHAYAKSRSGIKHMLRVRPMAPDGSTLLGDGQIVFHEPDRHPTIEGPKFLKRDGWYYILAPAGGVETGWQVVLRSRKIYGPYEDKIVLRQGNTEVNGPHQGALVDAPDASWWFVHFQDANVYGRIVHLQPVQWVDGWPLMGTGGQPVLRQAKPQVMPAPPLHAPQASDEFNETKLGLQWQWHANHFDQWFSLSARRNWLRFYPQAANPAVTHQPNLLLQKLPARSFVAETELDLFPMNWGEEAGVIILGESHASLGLMHDGRKNKVIFRLNDKFRILHETSANTVKLRIHMQSGGLCSFWFGDDGKAMHAPETFQATKGVWIGAKIGLYSWKRVDTGCAGHADFGYFRFFPAVLIQQQTNHNT